MEARLGPLTPGVVTASPKALRGPLKRSVTVAAALLVTLGSFWIFEHRPNLLVLGVAPGVAAQRSPVSAMAVGAPLDSRCARALEVVARAGLQLQVTTEFRCPGNTQTRPADRQHSGVACWHHENYCPEASYIAINPEHIREREDRMHYVIAHEICHIDHYLADGTPGTEAEADGCAAAAGFPR